MLFVGQTIGSELPASATGLRSWVAVYPAEREVAVEGKNDDMLRDQASFHVLRFEIESSAVERPTYDYDHYMSNVRRVDITSEHGFDEAIALLEDLLGSWGIDPTRLGPLGDEYPIF
jgi:hypothetical protein